MDSPIRKGNLLIIESDDDGDDHDKVKDEKTVDRDSAFSDSIRGSYADQQPPDKEVDLADTLIGIESIALDEDAKRSDLSNGAFGQSDELSSLDFGVDVKYESLEQNNSLHQPNIKDAVAIKDETDVTGTKNHDDKEKCVYPSKDQDPIHNILASLPPEDHSMTSVESLSGGAFDLILSHKLSLRDKEVKPKVHVPSTVAKQVVDRDDNSVKGNKVDDKIKDQEAPAVESRTEVDSDGRIKRQTYDKAKDENTSVVESDRDVDSGKDPATLSVKDKLSLFKKAPVPAPRIRKQIGIQSSVKERHSIFEKDKQTDEKEEVLRPMKRPDISSSFRKSLNFAEQASKPLEDEKEEVLRPKKRPEMRPSFRKPLNFAEQASKPVEDEKEEVLRPKNRPETSSSFRKSLNFAEQASKPMETSNEIGNLEVSGSSQIKLKPRPRSINPSFKAAREAIAIAPVQPFAGVKPRASLGLSEGRDFAWTRSLDQQKDTDTPPFSKPKAIPGLMPLSPLGIKDTRHIAQRQIQPEISQEKEKTKKDLCWVVAAMDFGTTYSAVAFSFKNEPYQILTNIDTKIPTVLLLDRDQTVHSFGDEAKTEFYKRFDENNTYKQWYYFECFKMKLYVTDKYFDKDIVLEDYSGKKMKALDVFSKAIGYLRKQLLDLLNDHRAGVRINPDSDIHWVLTVPAIWPDLSKAFMREAAEKAGIPTELLSLALEPEAASLYCRQQFGVKLRGKKFIVLDLGGGTADYVCHEVLPDDTIRECHMATGGDFGGKLVDNEFFKLFVQIYGGDVMGEFKKTRDYKEFCDEFELKKRKFDGSKDFTFRIPDTLHMIFERKIGQHASITINQSPLKDKVYWRYDKIVIKRDLAISIFDKAVNRIVDTTKAIMEKVKDIDYVIMVGGFSCSVYVIKCLKQMYPSDDFVISPDDPQLAVVKGAVIFGQDTKAITSRISKYTYGIGRAMIFKPGDPENRKFRANGAWWCEDCFCKHIEIGQEIGTDDEVDAIDYYPPDANVRNFFLEVFASTKKDPKYTFEDGCYSIGILRLEVDTQGDVWSKIEVKLIYKGTELELQAYDVKNKKFTSGKVEFWG